MRARRPPPAPPPLTSRFPLAAARVSITARPRRGAGGRGGGCSALLGWVGVWRAGGRALAPHDQGHGWWAAGVVRAKGGGTVGARLLNCGAAGGRGAHARQGGQRCLPCLLVVRPPFCHPPPLLHACTAGSPAWLCVWCCCKRAGGCCTQVARASQVARAPHATGTASRSNSDAPTTRQRRSCPTSRGGAPAPSPSPAGGERKTIGSTSGASHCVRP